MEHSTSSSIKARMMSRAQIPNVSPTNKKKTASPSSHMSENEQQQQQQAKQPSPPPPATPAGTSIGHQKGARGKAGSDVMESSGNRISPYTGNRADRPSGNVFTVQYASPGTRRRINHGSMGNPSPTPLTPMTPPSARTDLVMSEQYANAWSESVNAKYQQRIASPATEDGEDEVSSHRNCTHTLNLNTGFCYDKNSESLALRSMVSAALGRQALAQDGNNQRFLRVIKGAKAAKEQVNHSSNNTQVDISSFVAIYKQLLADILIVHDQHGYEKTVKCFLQLEPWLLGK